jgi:hypothetical protein
VIWADPVRYLVRRSVHQRAELGGAGLPLQGFLWGEARPRAVRSFSRPPRLIYRKNSKVKDTGGCGPGAGGGAIRAPLSTPPCTLFCGDPLRWAHMAGLKSSSDLAARARAGRRGRDPVARALRRLPALCAAGARPPQPRGARC